MVLIAHYHWQVGLVADGRLLAAAAAASSDTARGFARFYKGLPSYHPSHHLRSGESLGESGGLSVPKATHLGPRPSVGRRPGEEGN